MNGVSKSRLSGVFKKLRVDNFVLLLFLMIILARLIPGPGIYEAPFSLANLANYGVSFIFFFYGLRLSPANLVLGLSKWKLHLLVQLFTFLVFPLVVLAAMQLFMNEGNYYLWLGIFFLASLPSTVSSSIVMVSIAGGNIPAAIFNASVSSLLGVFVTPFWMGFFLESAAADYNPAQIIVKLSLQVLLPVVLGLLLHRKWGGFAERNKKLLKSFDQTIILIIVYTSFSESFARKMFQGFSVADLLFLSVGMLGLFLVIYFIIKKICTFFGFERQDTIAAIFCGSKKSLVHGTVMSKVLFTGIEAAGLLLLPLMIYHALQLIVASILAQDMAKR